jgi:hypothetical protein
LFIINLLVGLTQIKTRTFDWVRQVGMLAGTQLAPRRPVGDPLPGVARFPLCW